jgi:hypothetical protein
MTDAIKLKLNKPGCILGMSRCAQSTDGMYPFHNMLILGMMNALKRDSWLARCGCYRWNAKVDQSTEKCQDASIPSLTTWQLGSLEESHHGK